jgi:hypothetical protein
MSDELAVRAEQSLRVHNKRQMPLSGRRTLRELQKRGEESHRGEASIFFLALMRVLPLYLRQGAKEWELG